MYTYTLAARIDGFHVLLVASSPAERWTRDWNLSPADKLNDQQTTSERKSSIAFSGFTPRGSYDQNSGPGPWERAAVEAPACRRALRAVSCCPEPPSHPWEPGGAKAPRHAYENTGKQQNQRGRNTWGCFTFSHFAIYLFIFSFKYLNYN